MARKAREISLINSYTVIFNSANGIAFNNNDIKTFLFVLNANKQEDNYKVLGYYMQSKAFYLVLADINIGIDVFLRKISVSFAKRYNSVHARSGQVFKGRANTIPAKSYDKVYEMICNIHNLQKINNSDFCSRDNYFENKNIDYDYILQRFDTIENFENFCNKYNEQHTNVVGKKLSDEELVKYIYNTFSLTMIDMKDMSKGVLSKIISQIVKITKASARQISRVTSLPLRFLWELTKKSNNKVKDNEK